MQGVLSLASENSTVVGNPNDEDMVLNKRRVRPSPSLPVETRHAKHGQGRVDRDEKKGQLNTDGESSN